MIDCLIVGHNEIRFETYAEHIKKLGCETATYRDLSLNYINYQGKSYSATNFFNDFYCSNGVYQPLDSNEPFSATISYLGTYLNKNDLSFEFIKSFQCEKDKLKKILQNETVRTIAITTTLYVTPLPIIEIIEEIRKYNVEAKIIIGGPYISTQLRNHDKQSLAFLFKDILKADFYVNSSKGEETLVRIIKSLKSDESLFDTPNILYIKEGVLYQNKKVEESQKLVDNIVNWDLFANELSPFVNVRTAISCPFSCSFCGFPEHAGKYQYINVHAIQNELDKLNEISQVKYLSFIDDTFNVPVKRFKDILKLFIRKKYKFKWISNFRCQFADEETVKLMKESGCEGVFLGIESGSDRIINNMNKKTTVSDYSRGINLLKKYNIVTTGSFIIGFPGETQDTVKETISFINNEGIDFYKAQIWYGEPITPIYKEKDKYNIKGESFEWTHDSMDSKKACDFVDEVFFTVNNSIWMPQIYFEFEKIFSLIIRGFNLDKSKSFLKAFKNGINDKLNYPNSKTISNETFRQFINIKEDTTESIKIEDVNFSF